ncbi:hypothetical protein MKW94_028528 [Papaver nudicaule]|uniref:Glucosyltransferase 24 catalytic domain-containing protein n=1 Tax=Papaver nudicaule TaxID=74823 RepID=A0AA41V1S3_PAPNU|nr:hypothetical protein [Papaver nudicaule]
MGELYDMDMRGKPYGYTPFCDNNKDMDGFRFWRQGFWKEHLRGRPYHISALYVVDLLKFRQTAAGDNLRVFYETLIKDPNSLSNLDQDLPNYAQHTVPIFLSHRSGCGVNRGVEIPQKQRRRPLISVTIP